MNPQVKKYLLPLLHLGGHCRSMSEAMKCNRCGKKFMKAKAEYDRLRKEKPELFVRKEPEFKPSMELQNMFGKLVDRVKRDKLYQNHLNKSLYGSPEEKLLEAQRADSGYYKKHSG